MQRLQREVCKAAYFEAEMHILKQRNISGWQKLAQMLTHPWFWLNHRNLDAFFVSCSVTTNVQQSISKHPDHAPRHRQIDCDFFEHAFALDSIINSIHCPQRLCNCGHGLTFPEKYSLVSRSCHSGNLLLLQDTRCIRMISGCLPCGSYRHC